MIYLHVTSYMYFIYIKYTILCRCLERVYSYVAIKCNMLFTLLFAG